MSDYGGIINTVLSHLDTLQQASVIYILELMVVLGFSIAFLLIILRKTIQIILSKKECKTLLEVNPPAISEKSSYTTQQLFKVIHSLGYQRSFLERVVGLKKVFSFEIVSSKRDGIRYLIYLDKNNVETLKKSVLSYIPNAEIKKADDYIERLSTSATQVHEFRLKNHFAHPLRDQGKLIEHDPVAYITGAMTKLAEDELVAFQMVVTPTVRREAAQILRMIFRNENVLDMLNRQNSYFFPFSLVNTSVNKVVGVSMWVLSELIHGTYNYSYSTTTGDRSARSDVPVRAITNFETDAVSSIQRKVDQSLFEAQIRVLVSTLSKKDGRSKTRNLLSSFASFSDPARQSLVKKLSVPPIDAFRLTSYRERLLSLLQNKSSVVLSVSEVSDLYHFPYTSVTKTENIVKAHSKQLPAPLSLKKSKLLDVAFAKNTYGGSTTDIGLTREERQRHMYVIGATGTGKTTMLLSMIESDIKKGKGVCVVDPHGDLAEAAIDCIPDSRIKDFIYFNPFDIKHPIGINLLELTPGLDADDALIEKEFVAESVISLFRKVFSDAWSSHPHRIEYILRNTIHTAFTLPNPTLFTIFDLLNNPQYQKQAIRGLTDENLKNFWKYEFGRAGDYQKVKMVAPVTARIGRFLFSPSAKRILEQEKSSINFEKIMDEKKILICNLSKGKLGEDTSEVMGIMLLNKIQLAALRRSRVEQKKRKNFYLYVDEFQNFATPSFIQMLSEARKYGLNLTMAEQSTSQQKDKNLVQIVLANAGSVVTFRSANPKDEELLLPQFRPYVDFGEITNLPSFRFYMKKAAMTPEEPFSGTTVPSNVKLDPTRREKFIAASRETYALVYESKIQSNTSKKRSSTGSKTDTKVANIGALPA